MTLSLRERASRKLEEASRATRGEKLILKIVAWAGAEGISTGQVKLMQLDSLSRGSVRVMFSRLVAKGLIRAYKYSHTGVGGARRGIYVVTDRGKAEVT